MQLQAHGQASLELTADCLRRLRSYHWPGNVRELENVLERAVIIARDGKLNLRDVLPLTNLQPIRERKGGIAVDGLQTKNDLREAEKATLLRALQEAKWKVAGPLGAAQKLGIPPSTLSSRIKVLGIVRPR